MAGTDLSGLTTEQLMAMLGGNAPAPGAAPAAQAPAGPDLSGMPTEQLMAMLGGHTDPKAAEAASRAANNPTQDMGTLERLGAGFDGGLARIGGYASQGAASARDVGSSPGGMLSLLTAALQAGTGNPGALVQTLQTPQAMGANRKAADAAQAEQERLMAPLNATTAGGIGYGLGVSAPLVVAPELAPMRALGVAGRVGKVVDMAANGAAQGAGSSALAGEDPTMGAVGGMFAGPLAAGAGNLVAKGYNAARGAIDPAVKSLMDTAAANGLKTTIGDLGSSGWNNLEKFLKHVPGSGMRDLRQSQAAGLQDMNARIGGEMRDAAPAMDPEDAIAESVRKEYAKRTAEADKLYAQVPADTKVKTDNTTPALSQLLEQFPDALKTSGASTDTKKMIGSLVQREAPSKDDLKLIDFFKSSLDNPDLRDGVMKTLEQASPGIGDRLAGTAAVKPQELAVGDLHDLRKKLGNAARGLSGDAAHGEARSAILAARQAVDDDLHGAGENAGPLLKNATAYWRENIAPYRNNRLLSDMIDGGQAQGLIGKAGAKGNKDTADLVMNAAGPEGQAALQSGLYDKLTAPAFGDQLASGVSPSRGINALDIGDKVGQNRAAARIFSPDQKKQMTDLTAMMGHMREAASWNTETAGGAKTIPYFLGAAGSLLGGAPGVALPFIGARAAKMLTTSPAMQRLWYANGGKIPQSLLNASEQAGAGLFDQLR